MRAAVALVIVVAGACYRPGVDRECSVLCGAAQSCPSGASCAVDGYCHAADQTRMCGMDAHAGTDATIDAPADAVSSDSDIDIDAPHNMLCPFANQYAYFMSAMSWKSAEQACEALTIVGSSMKVHLATAVDQNDLTNILGVINPGSDKPWVGITSLAAAGSFRLVTDEPFFPQNLPWKSGQPDNDQTQRCALVISGGDLLDNDDCAVSSGYICECDTFPANPAYFP